MIFGILSGITFYPTSAAGAEKAALSAEGDGPLERNACRGQESISVAMIPQIPQIFVEQLLMSLKF